MNVTPHITKPRLTVIISSRSENPLFLRDGISSLPIVNLVSSAVRNQPNLNLQISEPQISELRSPRAGIPRAQPDRENLRPSGSRPTGTAYGGAVFILGRWGDGVKAPRCNAGVLVFCNRGGD